MGGVNLSARVSCSILIQPCTRLPLSARWSRRIKTVDIVSTRFRREAYLAGTVPSNGEKQLFSIEMLLTATSKRSFFFSTSGSIGVFGPAEDHVKLQSNHCYAQAKLSEPSQRNRGYGPLRRGPPTGF